MKLERRQAVQQAVEARRFNWKKFLKMSVRVLTFAVGTTILWQVLILLGLTFLANPFAQIVLFGGLYVLFFRWINADTLFVSSGPRRR